MVLADTYPDIHQGHPHPLGRDDHDLCPVLPVVVLHDDLYVCSQGRCHDANQVFIAHAVPVAGLFLAEQ